MENLVVRRDRCTRSLSRWVRCRECADHCPLAVVEVGRPGQGAALLPGCDGCGVCRTRCPVEAIGPSAWKLGAGGESLPVLCCNGTGHQAEHFDGSCLRVSCVREIGFRFLLTGWMLGLRRLVVLSGDCSGCDRLTASCDENGLERANEILALAGAGRIEVLPRHREGNGNRGKGEEECRGAGRIGRREFFRNLVSATVHPAMPPSGGPAREGEEAGPLFPAALDCLSARGDAGGKSRLAAYRIRISAEACYGCSACARLCPTAAIAWADREERSAPARLLVEPSRCLGCGVCRDVCDVDAVEIIPVPGWHDREEVLFREGVCVQCSRTFLSASASAGQCPGCRMASRLFAPAAPDT